MNERFKPADILEDSFTIEEEVYGSYYQKFFNGIGKWPTCVISDNPDYKFEGFDHPVSRSDEKDLRYLADLLLDLGHDIFVRDVSFLDFPAYYVYIPSMSSMWKKYLDRGDFFEHRKKLFRAKQIFRNFKDAGLKEIRELAGIIEEKINKPMVNNLYPTNEEGMLDAIFNIPNTNPKLSMLTADLFLFMLYYRSNDLKKALEYITRYLEKEKPERKIYLYYYCIRDYLKLKIKRPDSINSMLARLYKEDIAGKVIKDMAKPEEIFSKMELPNNFKCEDCKLSPHCQVSDYIHIIERIRKKKNNWHWSQSDII